MNKKHFYYFLPSLSTDFADFTVNYLCNLCNLLTTIVAHPGARTWCHAFAVVGVVLQLSSRTASSRKQKYLDYDVSSRRWNRTTARAMPGAGEGLSKIGQFDMSEYELVL